MNASELRNMALVIVNQVVPSKADATPLSPLWTGYRPPANGTSCGRLPQYMIIQLFTNLGLSPPKTQRWIGNGGCNVEFMLNGQIDHRPDAYVPVGNYLPRPGDIYWISGSGALHVGIVLSASQGRWETADSGAEEKGKTPAAKIRTRDYLGGKLAGEPQQTGFKMVPVMGWANLAKYFHLDD